MLLSTVEGLNVVAAFTVTVNNLAFLRQGKGKVCIRAYWLIRPELIPVSVA